MTVDALTLLSGDRSTFCEKVWGTAIHLHRTDPAPLVGLLPLGAVDELLTGSALRTPALRVVREGRVLPPAEFTRHATMAGSPVTGLVDSRKVLRHFDQGATVVLQGLHRYWPPLTRLVRELELALGHPCQANAYLTPPGNQGFARHRDTHDVFVFQTHGRKLWEVVDPADGDDAEAREVLLEPGLSMYLPTGTPHSARSESETSLHVTIGINRLTWRDAVRAVVDGALADLGGDGRLDDPLPAGYVDEPELLTGGLGELLAELGSRLGAVDPGSAAGARAEAFLTGRTPALAGGLTDLVRLPDLDDATVLARRPTTACALRDDGDRLVVLLGDRSLRMPARLRPVLEHVRDTERFAVGDLAAWLDEESRLVVTRRLVREGLLHVLGDDAR